MSFPFLPDRDERQGLTDGAMARIQAFLDALPDGPVVPSNPDVEEMHWDAPEHGRAVDEVLDELFHDVVPKGYNVRHPGFMAYIPNTALWAASVADLIASAVDRYPTVRVAGPAIARLEDEVLRWFAEWTGMPEGTGGLLTSGGSMANLSAFVAARHNCGETDLRRLRWYCSAQTHHSNHKAALIAGLPGKACVVVPSDDAGRIGLSDLRAAIEMDRKAGLTPFLVLGNAGTTDTGTIDDLDGLADIAAEQTLWFHVDGAYGGFFAMSPRAAPALSGIGRADSLTLDPHKGLGIPFGVGAVLVRDPQTLVAAHAMRGGYMPAQTDCPDASDMGLELSRTWRGLRVWLPVMVHGVAAFREALESSMDLVEDAASRLDAMDDIVLRREASLSVVAFRPTSQSVPVVLDRINAKGRVFLSMTRLDDGDWIRVCILNAATDQNHVDALIEDVAAALADGRP